jgi:hypothetical protein
MTLLDKWKVIAEMAADPDINRGEVAAAIVLLDSMSANGVVQLGHSVIAEDTGQTTRSAKRATDGLIEKRYFEQIGHGGPGCPNKYRRPESVRIVTDGQAGASGRHEVGTSTSPPVGTSTSPLWGHQRPTFPFTLFFPRVVVRARETPLPRLAMRPMAANHRRP